MTRPSFLRTASLLFALLCTPAALAQGSVTVLIWDEFLSPKVVKTLKNRHGLDIRQITFTTAEERDELLAKNNGRIDLVVADTTGLGTYLQRGILERIDGRRIPNLKHVLTRWQSDMDHAVPYLWGHTGIAWRTDRVKTPVRTYADLFALAKKNPGKVSLLDDAHEALMAARYAFGPAAPMQNATDVQAASRLLKSHLDGIRIVGSILDETAPLATGEVIAAQAYNGDIAFLRDNLKVPLAFVIPSPGCMIWQESFLMLKNAPNKDAAYEFLNEINQATLAAKNASEVRYATSNALAIPNLDPAFREDPVIRPKLDGLDKCYFYPVFDNGTQNALDAVELGDS
ncbi:MAG: ABC transporter substrate-binding protein [Pseudomonadota bacterium]